MKRLLGAAAIAAAAMLAFAGVASAQTADIYAGQNMLAGEVVVTPGASTTTVAINLDSGWCMTQSQIALAYDAMLLPTTKKGNPQPGQFPYKTTYTGCVQSDSLTIQNSAIPGPSDGLGNVYAAVHVDLFSTETHSMDVVSTVGQNVYGPLYAYRSFDSSDWGSPVAAVQPSFALGSTWPTISGASYISTALLTEMNPLISTVYAPDSWRMTKVNITPPAGSFLLGGTIDMYANSDNAQRVWFNGTKLNGGTGSGDAYVEGTCVDTHQWNSVEHYTFTPVAGTNTLAFVWRNFGLSGAVPSLCNLQYSQTSDPTGLIYKATVGYYSPTNHGETGWAAGTGFDGSNWATYMVVPLS